MNFIYITGHNGLYYIIQVISKLLDPKTSEHTASFVGRLVSVVIGKVGSQLGENLDLMLRAVLSKMQQAETLTVIQVLKVDILAGTDINPYVYVYGVYWIIPVHLSHFYIITNFLSRFIVWCVIIYR